MSIKHNVKVIIEAILPAVLGVLLLLLIPTQVDFSSSYTSETSESILFPKLIAWSMIILSIAKLTALIYVKLKTTEGQYDITLEKKDRSEVSQVDFTILFNRYGQFIIAIVVLLLYPSFIQKIGFWLASFILINIIIFILGKYTWWKALLYSIISTTVIWYAFVELLTIPLPKGIIENLLGGL